MRDLFDDAPVPGLVAEDGFLSEAEEAALIRHIDDAALTPFRFQQWTGKRLTCSFGLHYDFAEGVLAPAEPMPGWLEPIRDRAASFAGLPARDLVQALLIRYDPGAGIGWHRDRPIFDHVIGISLGTAATLRLRQRTDAGFRRAEIDLLPRSIYHLSGEVRYDWEHSIVPMERARWSITLRSLRR